MPSTSPKSAILATGLRKSYGDNLVLDGIDLEVERGQIFSLLGPNGAGKTTTVQILSTLIRPDAGQILVDGHDVVREPDAVRSAIGVTGQFAAVDDLLTGEENLRLMGDLHHLSKADCRRRVSQLLERFELTEAAGKPSSTYSGGMRRRLDIAMGLMGTPPIVFLDEPTTGLDPRSRQTTWELVRGLVDDGVTIVLTTQYLDEADELSDRIALLDHGRIVAQGTPEELKRTIPGGHITVEFTDASSAESALRSLGADARRTGDLAVQVQSDGGVQSLRTLLDKLDAEGVEPTELSVHTPDLDDVFLALTGQPTEKEAV